MSGNQEMAGSWRYLGSAGSKLSSLKGYIAREQTHLPSFRGPPPSHGARNAPALEADERQSWRAWAGEKIRTRRGTTDELNTEVVNVFPGWAARRYATGGTGSEQFEVEVSLSGYAVSCRPPEQATRSQRAFIRLAKGFASLPKLVDDPTNHSSNASSSSLLDLTPSTEALLAQVQLPPRPDEIADDFNVEELERRLQRARQASTDTLERSVNGFPPNEETNAVGENSESSPASSTDDLPRTLAAHPHLQQASIAAAMPIEVLRRLHANLEQRLQPFWSSALPNRLVELRLFPSPHQSSPSSSPSSAFASSVPSKDGSPDLNIDTSHGPLDTLTVLTAADGSFTAKFTVPWEKLCQHPLALHIAFGETVVEHDVVLVAQLVPVISSVPSMPQGSSGGPYGTYQAPRGDPSPSHSNPSSTPSNILTTFLRVPITHSPIRVVSDIDDTIKFSNILSGAKAVFQNVFVKDVAESLIPGMGEWYKSMWQRGVRFHYVSNGPFEMIAILNEFFQISEMPPGSIKLKSYAGRSLFSGLLSAPAARKRAGVVDILDAFPDSRFFLIGDTGEQDLELYADLAREKPDRILGVFVRDVDTGEYDPLDDPTGWQELGMGAAGSRPDEQPLVPRSESSENVSPPTTPRTTTSPLNVEFEHINYEQLRTHSEPAPPPYSETMEFQTSKLHRYTTQGAHVTTEPEGIDSSTPTMGSHPRADSAFEREFQEQVVKGRALSQPQMPWTRKGPYTPGNDIRTTSSASFITEPPKSPSIISSASCRFQSKLMAKLQNSTPSLPPASSISVSDSSSSSMSFRRKGSDPISPAVKKRQDLQDRVHKARTQMPGQVVLRIFRDPKECVEAEEILGQQGASNLLGGDR